MGRSRTQGRARSQSRARSLTSSGGTSRSGKVTTNHEEIRQWVEARGGHPATVENTQQGRQTGGVLRIDFPGFSGEQSLRAVSWDDWFQIFDERNLAFLYQDQAESRFNKLVKR